MSLVRLALVVAAATGLAPVRERVVDLRSGQTLQWLSCDAPGRLPFAAPPPFVVFVHGTFHGAWCWAEAWLPRFAERHGIDAHAVSLRGTSASPNVNDGRPVKLSEHAADLSEALAAVAPGRPVHLVAHSFGGPVVVDALAEGLEDVAGLALLCSVPPRGNSPQVRRVLFSSLRDAWLITRAFALKTAGKNPDDANKVFFNGVLDDATAARYASRFQADGATGLDLGDYTRSLPRWPTDADGAWTRKPHDLKALVVGCGADFVVDEIAVREMAAFLRVDPVLIPDAPHDLMLAPGVAPAAADLVADWVLAS